MLLNAGTFPTLRETSIEPMQEKIDLALVTMIISCYAQIVALFEEIFSHIRNRLESLVSDPIEPIDGLKFGAFPIGDGHLQGLIFFQIITSLLLKAEGLLGFPSPDVPPAMTDSRTELLSSDQSRLLRDQLTSRDGDHISRPTKLRSDVEHMQTILALARVA
ncbi:hypothetical protein ColLi_06630 [Colletotrichum liriopes]|uniref:Uncharacterized protein n=1 Tax=Colletotrichum liriopes TaxID=708192 RepID=A0AA37GNQ8_9PEZI|nr:hypothetical protein ColLi_06630 [Colletotrichum liriopes]